MRLTVASTTWLLACFAATAQAADTEPLLPLTPCRIEHPSLARSIGAECGTLSVPENPADAGGRRIGLHVARVPAVSRRKAPDALFVLAGGPGGAATEFYAAVAPAFERIRRERDIVLVDQRGTGRSNGLYCEFDESVLSLATPEVIEAETRRCLATLSLRADVAYYTTSLAVRDLDRVRAALGYERINLYGASYGTRVALHYLRRFPQRARSLILDGVVPPAVPLGPTIALDAERALDAIFARCREAPECRERFGDPAADYRALLERLQRRPVHVHLPDPTSGEPLDLELGDAQLATVLRLSSYTAEQAALLPLTLHLANREENFGPLGAQFLLVSRPLGEALAYGMHNTVVCTEDVPYYDPSAVDRAQLARTYIGTAQLDALLGICREWPRGPIDADFHEPLRSDAPVLLLSGSDDPVTPATYGERAQRGLPNSRHLVMRGQGHGQLTVPCMDRVMADFVGRASVNGLDTACAERVRPTPFFTSLAGPPP